MKLRFVAPVMMISGIAFASAGFATPYPYSDARSSRAHMGYLHDGSGVSVTTATTTVRSPRLSKQDQAKARFRRIIAKHAKANGVPMKLAHAVIAVESRYNPRARGKAGEIGLMQIKPSTARGIGYRGSTNGLYDPETNLHWGMKYLGKAQRLGGGSVCGTILKYNAGHYAKRMNKVSARYCSKVKRLMAKT